MRSVRPPGVGPITLCTLAARRTPIGELLPLARAAGFEAVELWGPHIDGMPLAALRALRAQADDLGLELLSVAPYLSFTRSAEMAETSKERARRFVLYAQILGCRLFRTFTDVGAVGTPGSAATEAQWTMGVEALRWLAAEDRGITFAVETHPATLADTPENAERLMDAVAAPNLRLLFQAMGRDSSAEALLAQYERLLPRIAHMHLAGAAASGGSCPIDEGVRDAGAVLARIRALGQRHPVALEYCWGEVPWQRVVDGAGVLLGGLRAPQGSASSAGASSR